MVCDVGRDDVSCDEGVRGYLGTMPWLQLASSACKDCCQKKLNLPSDAERKLGNEAWLVILLDA